MSSDNSFYRYRIEGTAQLTDECFARRSKKARQNNKSAFFFELDSALENTNSLADFLKRNSFKTDAVLMSLHFYRTLSPLLSCDRQYVHIRTTVELTEFLQHFESNPTEKFNLLFTPTTSTELKAFLQVYFRLKDSIEIFWRFQPYDENLPKSLTVADINSFEVEYRTIPGLEIHNTKAPVHYELEPNSGVSYTINWKFQVPGPAPIISVIIPTYNNLLFLSNVLWHLINQNFDKNLYEVIVADDGSTDGSSDALLNLFESYRDKINLTYIYWSKIHPQLGDQKFFRSGLARNLAARYSVGKNLVFLDSDMIVPDNFISVCIEELKSNDLIQFQRFHIHQEQSKRNPLYKRMVQSPIHQ